MAWRVERAWRAAQAPLEKRVQREVMHRRR
jgi:hypothetical protein